MRYRRLGRTGLKVSELCLGTMTFGWTADEATSQAIMNEAVERGINFLDTADIYSGWSPHSYPGKSEEFIGRWLKDQPRDQIIIATKVRGSMSEHPTDQGLSRHHIMAAVEKSLRRLQTGHIDLYQTHYPDEETPLEETLRALDDLQRQGKVRYVGCSNYPAWQLCKALWISDKHDIVRYDSLQPHYNLVNRAEVESELAPLCLDQGIGMIPYSPLAGGFLSGKYRKDQPIPPGSRGETNQRIKSYMNDRNWGVIDTLDEISRSHNHSIAATALAWIKDAPGVSSAIIGAKTVDQLRENLAAADFVLSSDERAALDRASDWQDAS